MNLDISDSTRHQLSISATDTDWRTRAATVTARDQQALSGLLSPFYQQRTALYAEEQPLILRYGNWPSSVNSSAELINYYTPEQLRSEYDIDFGDMQRAIDREISIQHDLDRISQNIADAVSRYGDAQHQQVGDRAVLVIRLKGSSRIDFSTLTIDGGLAKDILELPGSEEQYVAISLPTPSQDSEETRDEQFAGAPREFHLTANTVGKFSDTENARTTAMLPALDPPQVCDGPAGRSFLTEFEGRGASAPGCYGHNRSQALETVSVPTNRAARIDYTSTPTATAGTLSWTVDRPLAQIEASYVDLAHEARDGRNFALSATAFGFAAAVAPLGLERLDRNRRARRRLRMKNETSQRPLDKRRRRLRPGRGVAAGRSTRPMSELRAQARRANKANQIWINAVLITLGAASALVVLLLVLIE